MSGLWRGPVLAVMEAMKPDAPLPCPRNSQAAFTLANKLACWRRGLVLCVLTTALLVSFASAQRSFDRLNQVAQQRYGNQGRQIAAAWVDLLKQSHNLSELDKLRRVNSYFNARLRFEDDIRIWGKSDYWATPLESLARGSGDCEDFSIAKFFSLRAQGIPAEKLRMIYVRAQLNQGGFNRPVAHMVLGYFPTPQSEPLVLDNLVGRILPASQRPDLTPVFSFNDQGLWAGGRRAAASPTARLSHWRNLLARLANEGFL